MNCQSLNYKWYIYLPQANQGGIIKMEKSPETMYFMVGNELN
jgi:hypothetical protein